MGVELVDILIDGWIANAVKILKDMHEKGQIEGRAAGLSNLNRYPIRIVIVVDDIHDFLTS